VNLEFSIGAWAAFGPGLVSPDLWQAWATEPFLPAGDAQPELKEMPAMARRRLGPLGRTALQVAFQTHGEALGVPVVLGSRYGDSTRSLELLAELAGNQPLSPTAFGLSVHNAIGALYSITRGDHANYVSVAAGRDHAAAALVEAAGLLGQGAAEVMVICYDAPLPGIYAQFADEPQALYAWAWRVSAPRLGQPRYSLQACVGSLSATGATRLPMALDVLRFMLAGDAELVQAGDSRTWTWRRHD
jgi:hypothetical protein